MRNDMKKWRAYGKGMGYLKNQEIQDCIRAHRVSLDTALSMVGVSIRDYLYQSYAEVFATLTVSTCARADAVESAVRGRSGSRLCLTERHQQQAGPTDRDGPAAAEGLERFIRSSTWLSRLTSQLLQMLITKNIQVPEDYGLTSPTKEVAMKQLFQIRSTRRDSAVLPFRELRDEIQKTGQRAVHAGTNLTHWTSRRKSALIFPALL